MFVFRCYIYLFGQSKSDSLPHSHFLLTGMMSMYICMLHICRFFRQYLLLVCTQQMSAALFRAIAAVCQTMILANTVGFILLLIIFMMGGFVIPKTDIQKWWIWAYWIPLLVYADNAAFVNEFKADRWAKVGYQTNPFFLINPIPFCTPWFHNWVTSQSCMVPWFLLFERY